MKGKTISIKGHTRRFVLNLLDTACDTLTNDNTLTDIQKELLIDKISDVQNMIDAEYYGEGTE